jgi:hypothetical protein
MKSILIPALAVLIVGFAASAHAKPSRSPASAKECVHFPSFPTLECTSGYEVEEVSDHCWACVAYAPPTCIKVPTLTCVQGYALSRDEQGCFHCTAPLQSSN